VTCHEHIEIADWFTIRILLQY